VKAAVDQGFDNLPWFGQGLNVKQNFSPQTSSEID
jgi:hypothetical protein